MYSKFASRRKTVCCTIASLTSAVFFNKVGQNPSITREAWLWRPDRLGHENNFSVLKKDRPRPTCLPHLSHHSDFDWSIYSHKGWRRMGRRWDGPSETTISSAGIRDHRHTQGAEINFIEVCPNKRLDRSPPSIFGQAESNPSYINQSSE